MTAEQVRLSTLPQGALFLLGDEEYSLTRVEGEEAQVVRLAHSLIPIGGGETRVNTYGVERLTLASNTMVSPATAPEEPEPPSPPEKGEMAEELPSTALPVLTKEKLQTMYAQAQEAPKPRPRRLTIKELIVALQRKWLLAYPKKPIPEDLDKLEGVVPSGISRTERAQWLLGGLEEAKMTFLRLLNSSYTKGDFQKKAQEAGLSHALDGFPKDTRKELEKAISYLSD